MSEFLSPRERIRKQKDFTLLYRRGSRFRGKYFNLVFLSNDLDFSRMAVVASKKVGNAVTRNKVKRRMRTLFRRNKELFDCSWDLVIIIKQKIKYISWHNLRNDYFDAIKFVNRKSQAV